MSDLSFEAEPYKGLESYQAEDAEFFFGRDREAAQLIATVLSARISLLHARSGAGKTSLLNAKIIPGLEWRGRTPVRVLFQNDPVESVRVATLRDVCPPPEAEVRALERARDALAPDTDATLGELLDRYLALEAGHREKRRLLKPVEVTSAPKVGALPAFGDVTPYFCRLLRASIDFEIYSEHLAAMTLSTEEGPVVAESTVSDLHARLSDRRLVLDYERLLEELYLPVPGLRSFFENLIAIYGESRSDFSLVLIFDQFEELFTRFRDPGPLGTQPPSRERSWRPRAHFIEELRSLCPERGEAEEAGPPLPVRCVISIRDEYLAELDPVYRFAPRLGHCSYHITPLEKENARDAIRVPAELYGRRYEEACFERLVEQLVMEDRYVEPVHLQLVCDKLWHAEGRETAKISLGTFTALGEAPGILASYFRDSLSGLADDERLETLEMLEMLVTSGGTRNIAAREEFFGRPHRNRQLREALLQRLLERKLVRTERRLGGDFVEITHEFLIRPILEAVRDEVATNPDYSRFHTALSLFEGARRANLRAAGTSPLPADSLRILEEQERRFDWSRGGAEVLFRCAILEGLNKKALRAWSDRLREGRESADPHETATPEGRFLAALASPTSERSEVIERTRRWLGHEH